MIILASKTGQAADSRITATLSIVLLSMLATTTGFLKWMIATVPVSTKAVFAIEIPWALFSWFSHFFRTFQSKFAAKDGRSFASGPVE